ncbi:MlaE family ABC transporter permease [Flavobacterium wongokense]|uniref:MlaE family ABC transporter permease n=1 Tax=Flavobacterium wongokense TaxID=2910674 RepID=UPI001F258C20|nr:ABC transporter permease [Flavobacterium sp. WG47]MCF6132203.1 ABC transporter permease [Flavobacterium sp. WG47]
MMKIVPVSNIRRYAHKKTIDLSDETLTHKSKFTEFIKNSGDVALFVVNVFRNTFSTEFEFKEFIRQCYAVGNRSLGLISITGIVIGLVLTIQSRPVLVDFGAVTMLPGMVAISIIREMGPVITALICAGKVGSGIGAELGSMRVTEQIDAMEVSSTNPVRFLIVPRVLATTLMIPLLIMYADILGILGSWIASNIKGDVSFVLFITQAFGDVDFMDFIPAVIKSFFFGAVIGLVGCYQGFNAGRGTESVGVAANAAVVMGSLLVILVDLIAVQITDLL